MARRLAWVSGVTNKIKLLIMVSGSDKIALSSKRSSSVRSLSMKYPCISIKVCAIGVAGTAIKVKYGVSGLQARQDLANKDARLGC